MKKIYLLEVGIVLGKNNNEFDLYLREVRHKEGEQKSFVEKLSLYNTNIIMFTDKDKRQEYINKYIQEATTKNAYAMYWEQEINDEDYQNGKEEIEKYGYTDWVDIDFTSKISGIERNRKICLVKMKK